MPLLKTVAAKEFSEVLGTAEPLYRSRQWAYMSPIAQRRLKAAGMVPRRRLEHCRHAKRNLVEGTHGRAVQM